MKKYKYHAIYSLTPSSPKTDYYRLIELFDNKEGAEFVLTALEKVNMSFHCYIIVEEYLEDIKIEKEVLRNNGKSK